MNEPIYPDKTKTGLAALKPLTDAFFAEPERWVWEVENRLSSSPNPPNWREVSIGMALVEIQTYGMDGVTARLTPKPRRVWIGGESFQPLDQHEVKDGDAVYLADVVNDAAHKIYYSPGPRHRAWRNRGFLFISKEHAQQCLDAYRKARRVE